MEIQENQESKKSKKSTVIRIVALIAALAAAVGSIFIIRGCSAPPKYEEIKGRFEQLVNDSHKVNKVIFGEGLPTYERVSDPKDDLEVYNTGETYVDGNGKQQERKVWYYRALDGKNEIYAFRSSYLEKFSYVFVSDKEMEKDALASLFPAINGVSAPKGKEFYSNIYTSQDKKSFSYLVPYKEKEVEYYYSSQIPVDYDVIRTDSEYRTVDEIKALVQSVYSRNYALSLYSSLFDGIASEDDILKARFTPIVANGKDSLGQLNTSEPLFTEQRVYKFETAKIKKWGSSSKLVRISVETYLPFAPDKIVEVEIALALQDGQWFLDSPTF